MMRWQDGAKLVFALMLAVPFSATALGQSADEAAQVIQRNLEHVELQIRVAPTAAEEDLERQKRELDSLRGDAPDHPLLPSLEQRIGELEDEIAAALAQQPGTGEETEQFVPLHAPAEVRCELREVETLQTRADREMMRGAEDSAAEYLSEAERLIEAIEAEYGERIPPGYSALIVAKERSAALQDQLGHAQQE
jgi:hypothetical protein